MNTSLAYDVVPLAKELDENKVTPGVLGFIVFALLGVAVWFLLKSMNRHLGKVDFKEKSAGGAAGGDGSTAGGDAGTGGSDAGTGGSDAGTAGEAPQDEDTEQPDGSGRRR